MDVADVLVLQASYTNPVHAEAIALVLNHYAEDPMGGGQALAPDVLQQLPGELAKRPHAFSVLAFVCGEPAGLVPTASLASALHSLIRSTARCCSGTRTSSSALRPCPLRQRAYPSTAHDLGLEG